MPCASSRKRCRSEHRANRQWRGCRRVCVQGQVKMSQRGVFRELRRRPFPWPIRPAITPKRNDLRGVQLSESPQAETALPVDGYE
jgi:hypothetical protein